MPDRETVITHLQIIHIWAKFARERDLNFFTKKHLEDIAQWSDDTIALLKEQEAVKPVLDEQTGRIWLCGNCGTYVGFEDNDPHDPNEFDKFCRECGRPVLWENL